MARPGLEDLKRRFMVAFCGRGDVDVEEGGDEVRVWSVDLPCDAT